MKVFVLLVALAPVLFSQNFPISELTANNTSAARGLNTPPANTSKLPIRSLLYPGATTKILVRYMGWHGSAKHKNVGYRSDDPAQVRRQVQDMASRGIDGTIVAWYGPDTQPQERSTELLFQQAEDSNFSVAISIDSGALDACRKSGCDLTTEFIRLLHFVEQHYEGSPAYLRINGRPLVTSFGLETANLDWDRIRAEARNNPLFVFRNSGGFTHAQSDGGFSWIAPESATPDDAVATAYLKRFNKAALASGGKVIIASAYKGFDDSQASWGKGHKIPANCGETWLATFDLLNGIYSRQRQLPFLIIPTWNDYEEGTEIEPGIDNCVSIRGTLDGNHLSWQIDGPKSTIDHYEIYASSDGKSATQIGTARTNDHDFKLNNSQMPRGTRQLYVYAVGKPSIQNHLSAAIPYNSR
jgi:hypothetical protein